MKDLGFCGAGRPDSTWHQSVHDGASAIAFLAILAAMFVFTRPFRDHGWTQLARFSTLVGAAGIVLLVVFIALSDSSAAGIAEIVFLLAPLGWVELSGSSWPGACGLEGAIVRRTGSVVVHCGVPPDSASSRWRDS